jgi:hypothetical protein
MERMAGEGGGGGLVAPIAAVLSVSIAGIASAWLSGSARVPFVIGLDRFLPPPSAGCIRSSAPVSGARDPRLPVHRLPRAELPGRERAQAYHLADLAVVLQLHLYLHAALLRHSAQAAPPPVRYSKRTLRVALRASSPPPWA